VCLPPFDSSLFLQILIQREEMKKWFVQRRDEKSDKLQQQIVVQMLDENQDVDKMDCLKEETAQYQTIFEKMEIVTGFGMNEPEEVAKRCNSRKEQADAATKQETELLHRLESLAKVEHFKFCSYFRDRVKCL
jgi:hypothetical protein